MSLLPSFLSGYEKSLQGTRDMGFAVQGRLVSIRAVVKRAFRAVGANEDVMPMSKIQPLPCHDHALSFALTLGGFEWRLMCIVNQCFRHQICINGNTTL